MTADDVQDFLDSIPKTDVPCDDPFLAPAEAVRADGVAANDYFDREGKS